MADNKFAPEFACGDYFKEAVCIDANRVYDSCSDKDCLEDIRVLFPCNKQQLIDCATGVRIKDCKVITIHMDLQPIAFNKGHYSIDMTFFFDVSLELYNGQSPCGVPISGVSVFNKKVILYGSEGNVKMFSSDTRCEDLEFYGNWVLPKAVVQVAEPIGLSARLCERCRCDDGCRKVPDNICKRYGGEFDMSPRGAVVYATIGLFSIVQLIRNVQMLIPAYDFCIPEKECISASDNPCELFSQIDFPTDEFFPPKAMDGNCDCR